MWRCLVVAAHMVIMVTFDSLPPHASLTSPHPSIDNVFNCEVKQQGWFLITLLSRLKTLISFSYTLVKNEGELH